MNQLKNQCLERLLRAASRACDPTPDVPLSYVTTQRVLAEVRKLRSPQEESIPTGFLVRALCAACCVTLLVTALTRMDSGSSATRTEFTIANSAVMSNLLP